MLKKLFSLSAAILLMAGSYAFAQTATGNVFGDVTDTSGGVLPGASVTISGEAGTRSTVTGTDGAFRFLNLDYGDYTVSISMQGFGTVNRKVTIVTGSSSQVSVSLAVGTMSDTIEVTAEAALVDIKKRGTSTTLSTSDLKDTPNSRDPWGIMNQVPGALIDRVNIAGNENGQQAAVGHRGLRVTRCAARRWDRGGPPARPGTGRTPHRRRPTPRNDSRSTRTISPATRINGGFSPARCATRKNSGGRCD